MPCQLPIRSMSAAFSIAAIALTLLLAPASLSAQGGRGGAAPRLVPGAYSLKLTLGSDSATGTLKLREDPILTK